MRQQGAIRVSYRWEKNNVSKYINALERNLENNGDPLQLSIHRLPELAEARERRQSVIERERAEIEQAWRGYDRLWGDG